MNGKTQRTMFHDTVPLSFSNQDMSAVPSQKCCWGLTVQRSRPKPNAIRARARNGTGSGVDGRTLASALTAVRSPLAPSSSSVADRQLRLPQQGHRRGVSPWTFPRQGPRSVPVSAAPAQKGHGGGVGSRGTHAISTAGVSPFMPTPRINSLRPYCPCWDHSDAAPRFATS